MWNFIRRGQLGVYDDRITTSATNLPDFSQQPFHCYHREQEDDDEDAMRLDFQKICDTLVRILSIQFHGTDHVLQIGVPCSKLTALKNIYYTIGFSSVYERAGWSYKELLIAFSATEKIYLFFNQRGDAVFYSHKILQDKSGTVLNAKVDHHNRQTKIH